MTDDPLDHHGDLAASFEAGPAPRLIAEPRCQRCQIRAASPRNPFPPRANLHRLEGAPPAPGSGQRRNGSCARYESWRNCYVRRSSPGSSFAAYGPAAIPAVLAPPLT